MDLKSEINHHLYSLWLEPEPTDDPDEKHRRHEVLAEAGQRALAAANESPGDEPSPARMRAILEAMMTYGRARLAGDEAEFRVERSSNGKLASAPSWMIAMVEKVTQDLLRGSWDKAPERDVVGLFVSNRGRYGEAQRRGTQRRFDTERKRIASIRAAARAMATQGPAILPDYELSEQKARSWVRSHGKASKVAEELIADYINAIAMNRDKIIEQYNRNVDETVERHNRVADDAHRKDPDNLKIDPSGKSELKPNITARWVKSTAQRGREKLVHLRQQDEGLKRIESKNSISQAPTAQPDEPSGD